MKRYYTFHYTEVEGKEIISQGEHFYFTTGLVNVDEMKDQVKEVIGKPEATILVNAIKEIDQMTFDRFVKEKQ